MILTKSVSKSKNLNFITDYNGFLTRFRNEFQKEFRTLFYNIQKTVGKEKIKYTLETGLVPIGVRQEITSLVSDFCNKTLEKLTATAGERALKSLKEQRPDFMFDETTIESFKAVQTQKFIEMVVNTQMKAYTEVYDLITQTNRFDTVSVDELAGVVSMGTGLNPQYMKSSLKYYIGAVESGLSKKRAKDNTKRFMNKRYVDRSKTYAQDAILNSYREAEYFTVEEGLRQNIFHGVVKKWSTAGDNRVCAICKALKKQTVPFNENFSYEGKSYSGIGGAHPHCRCGIIFIDEELYESGVLG